MVYIPRTFWKPAEVFCVAIIILLTLVTAVLPYFIVIDSTIINLLNLVRAIDIFALCALIIVDTIDYYTAVLTS